MVKEHFFSRNNNNDSSMSSIEQARQNRDNNDNDNGFFSNNGLFSNNNNNNNDNDNNNNGFFSSNNNNNNSSVNSSDDDDDDSNKSSSVIQQFIAYTLIALTVTAFIAVSSSTFIYYSRLPPKAQLYFFPTILEGIDNNGYYPYFDTGKGSPKGATVGGKSTNNKLPLRPSKIIDKEKTLNDLKNYDCYYPDGIISFFNNIFAGFDGNILPPNVGLPYKLYNEQSGFLQHILNYMAESTAISMSYYRKVITH